MITARIAPFAVAAAFGLAFASACDDEMSVADAVVAAAAGPDRPAPPPPIRQWVESSHRRESLQPGEDQILSCLGCGQ
ncbi:hypothetical protein [Actinoplanes sp. L3-i22]|uniref:hypothetical protein n=1 Tax=Actinoplanes sp. L3-i22 TaxID=2836373 RepID=UPI001C755FE0|nr:hypothetical protein [Actinoplanes sp. L3-i22]BCY08210.1 hypothetical protein L3i22_032980 [Actinoplanes sp. L3-i22]